MVYITSALHSFILGTGECSQGSSQQSCQARSRWRIGEPTRRVGGVDRS